MTDINLKIISEGCYAVADGKTINLPVGIEISLPEKQALVFLKSGKAEETNSSKKLINNKNDDEDSDDGNDKKTKKHLKK